ncbi:F-box/kelch-repeat protein At5g15710 [Selaginella moellendorffii]|nr:F-box/kelch-repeat protein At5g15710 [Selaginella moellendorffii]|eukprot:XP_002984239.2 F-box/kelch-repeat protein At5g15710 [Selaginella moellendorffii]
MASTTNASSSNARNNSMVCCSSSSGLPQPITTPRRWGSLPPYMDWRLWGNLPDDLVERVLAWLPIPSFFRLRSVSRRWRSIMYSKGFMEMCADVPPKGLFFLKVARCRCRMLAAYYPSGNKWLNIPIGFLPSQVSVPAASSKGLMCFIATQYTDGYSVLLVCNPLTRCWKALPPMTTRRYPFVVALVTDRKLSAYKVIVAGDYNSFDNRRTTEVYDSVTSTWKQSGPLPREEEITKNIVACNGYLFCLSRGPGNGLLAYSLQQEIWIKVRTGRMPGYSKFRHLVECNGRIIIVGKALRRQVLGLYIWHLDPPTMKWKELAKMPQPLSEQFFRTQSECFFCSALGDQIFISRFFCDIGLLYNISHDTWQWIPDCPKIANPFILTLEPGFDAVY